MSRILITGSSGFVAKNLIDALAPEGFPLTLQTRSRLEINPIGDSDIKICAADLDLIPNDILKDCHSIVHLACAGVDPNEELSLADFFDANVQKPYRLLLKGLGIGAFKKIIIVGSCFQYGHSSFHKGKNLSVRDACLPVDQYSATKTALESLAIPLPQYFQTTVSIIRPFNLYGAHERKDRLFPYISHNALNQLSSIITSGIQVKYFTPVSRLVDTIKEKLITQNPQRGFSLENLLGGTAKTVDQFARDIYLSHNLDPDNYLANTRPSRKIEPPFLLPDTNDSKLSVETHK